MIECVACVGHVELAPIEAVEQLLAVSFYWAHGIVVVVRLHHLLVCTGQRIDSGHLHSRLVNAPCQQRNRSRTELQQARWAPSGAVQLLKERQKESRKGDASGLRVEDAGWGNEIVPPERNLAVVVAIFGTASFDRWLELWRRRRRESASERSPYARRYRPQPHPRDRRYDVDDPPHAEQV